MRARVLRGLCRLTRGTKEVDSSCPRQVNGHSTLPGPSYCPRHSRGRDAEGWHGHRARPHRVQREETRQQEVGRKRKQAVTLNSALVNSSQAAHSKTGKVQSTINMLRSGGSPPRGTVERTMTSSLRKEQNQGKESCNGCEVQPTTQSTGKALGELPHQRPRA